MRLMWKYGTILVSAAVGAVVGAARGGGFEDGIGAMIGVAFGSMFLNWALFATTALMRKLAVVLLSLDVAITVTAYAYLAGWSPLVVAFVAAGSSMIPSVLLDKFSPQPRGLSTNSMIPAKKVSVPASPIGERIMMEDGRSWYWRPLSSATESSDKAEFIRGAELREAGLDKLADIVERIERKEQP